MARETGAKKVYFASAAPPVRFPNVYGIDMPTTEELIANDKSEDEIAEAIGADRLIYQDLDDLVEAAMVGNPKVKKFDTSCFTGNYVTGDVSNDYLERVSSARSDAAKLAQEMPEESLVDLSISDSSV